jgi:rhodanese-related sulfurtransferase
VRASSSRSDIGILILLYVQLILGLISIFFSAGHLDDAILLPRGVLEFKISGVEELADKSAAVLIYCRTGGRAALATQTMQELGYNNVMSIAGGFEAWSKA